MRKVLGMSPELLRVAARLLLMTLSVTTLGPVLHDVHDAEWQTPLTAHDESEHQYEDATPRGASPFEADHCVACHFVRTSRGIASWVLTGLHAFTEGHLLFHSDGHLIAALFAPPTPARAPPTIA